MSVATSFVKYWKATSALLVHSKGRDLEENVCSAVLDLIQCSIHLDCFTRGWNSKYKKNVILCTFDDDSYLEIVTNGYSGYGEKCIIEDIRLQSVRNNKFFTGE